MALRVFERRLENLELIALLLDRLLRLDVGTIEVVDGHLELRNFRLVFFLEARNLRLHASLGIGERRSETIDFEPEN